MDMGFYKRARGIVVSKPKSAAMPFNFYPRKPPAQVAPAAPAQQPAAGSRVKQPAVATTIWSSPAQPPPSAVVAMEAGGSNNGVAPGGGSDADVDRRAALYISRVQERLRRERMVDDWRMYY